MEKKEADALEILYEDAAVLAAVKPVGVVSQGEGPDAMPALLCRQRSLPAVYPAHRLDQAVGGAMLFAKTPKAAARLSQLVAEGRIQKEYLAVLTGVPAAREGTLEDLLFHDKTRNKTFVVKRQRAGVRAASLTYKIIGDVPDGAGRLSLALAALQTGRTHQIRVQFASRGYPLLGDGKYGGRDNRCPPALWSYRLTIPRETGGPLVVTAAPPDNFPWNLFAMPIF
jgi:23S rRNA pseudouridine1911/1915/1917 synthase